MGLRYILDVTSLSGGWNLDIRFLRSMTWQSFGLKRSPFSFRSADARGATWYRRMF